MSTAPLGQTDSMPGDATTRLVDRRFKAEHISTRKALADIKSIMERQDFDRDLIGRVEIVLAELFNNIAEHAYGNLGAGDVRCIMGINKTRILVEVTDHGDPMPNGEIPEGNLPNLDVALDDLPEGGFGWFLIRAQTDHLSYQRMVFGNCTRLGFELSPKLDRQ